MNPVDHPHGGERVEPLEEETLFQEKVFLLKERKHETIKELTN